MPIRNRLHTLLPPLARMGVCCAVVLFLAGCGGHNRGTVTGIVKYQGKAVPSGQVSFIPPDGIPVTADIRADGSYEAPKVLYGEAIVTVIQRPADYQSPAEVALAGRNKSQPS